MKPSNELCRYKLCDTCCAKKLANKSCKHDVGARRRASGSHKEKPSCGFDLNFFLSVDVKLEPLKNDAGVRVVHVVYVVTQRVMSM